MTTASAACIDVEDERQPAMARGLYRSIVVIDRGLRLAWLPHWTYAVAESHSRQLGFADGAAEDDSRQHDTEDRSPP